MRPLLFLALLVVAACSEASISRVDSRTYTIESAGYPAARTPRTGGWPSGSAGGYRVVDQTVHRNTPDRARDEPGVFTNWTIRCL